MFGNTREIIMQTVLWAGVAEWLQKCHNFKFSNVELSSEVNVGEPWSEMNTSNLSTADSLVTLSGK